MIIVLFCKPAAAQGDKHNIPIMVESKHFMNSSIIFIACLDEKWTGKERLDGASDEKMKGNNSKQKKDANTKEKKRKITNEKKEEL